MNKIMERFYPTFTAYQQRRQELTDILSDADLAFQPAGSTLNFGQLCRQMGETQQDYVTSFKTFACAFEYQHDDPEVESSVAKLSAWYQAMDSELKSLVENLSDDDLENKLIDRGGGFEAKPRLQLAIYQEALLIFYGKASIYLRMLEKPLPGKWPHWIA